MTAAEKQLAALTDVVEWLRKQEKERMSKPNWWCGSIVCARTSDMCELARAKLTSMGVNQSSLGDMCAAQPIAYCFAFRNICFTSLKICESQSGRGSGDPSCIGVE